MALSLEKFATTLRADFRFAPLNALLLVAIFVIGLVVHLANRTRSRWQAVVLCLGSALALAVLLAADPGLGGGGRAGHRRQPDRLPDRCGPRARCCW